MTDITYAEEVQIMQALYECEKCGEVDALSTAIGASTVYTRLCPRCETDWGRYIRAFPVWLSLLQADWAERHAMDAIEASRAIADGQRYRREIADIAEKWLGRSPD